MFSKQTSVDAVCHCANALGCLGNTKMTTFLSVNTEHIFACCYNVF